MMYLWWFSHPHMILFCCVDFQKLLTQFWVTSFGSASNTLVYHFICNLWEPCEPVCKSKKQWWHWHWMSLSLFGMYIDKWYGRGFSGYLAVAAVLLYAENCVLLQIRNIYSRSYMSFAFPVNVNFFDTKIVLFGWNKRKLEQTAFDACYDQIEITCEHRSLEIDLL